jgi:hypothetical protein
MSDYPMPSDFNEAEEADRQRRQAERLLDQAEEQAERDRAEYRNKWERMTGRPCKPPGGPAGLPTSPPPPRKRGRDE